MASQPIKPSPSGINSIKQISYELYGLRLECDRRIPGLVPCNQDSMRPADIFVHSFVEDAFADEDNSGDESLWYVTDILDASGNPALKIWKRQRDGSYRIRYCDGPSFLVDAAARNISIHCPKTISFDEAALFFVGPVLGIVLRLRGVSCLHASAARIGDSAIAFVGCEGAGKSTTAALFAQKGHAILTDDIVALSERAGEFIVSPAYPYLNLWPESVAMLHGPVGAAGAVPRDADKRQIRLDGRDSAFQREALPLRAIYLLAQRSSAADAPRIEPLSPQDALVALVANTYGNKLLDANMRAQEFRFLGRLVAALPVRRLIPAENPSLLPRLYQAVTEDFVATTSPR
ncbi:MAG TPA: hypothetical protein VGR81_11065 [Candidatus Acidoferrales bacterium]|nr:hypothetical protein [Candidatus Acidoferrales bacterium]